MVFGRGREKDVQHDLRAVFDGNYVPIQYAYVQFLSEHLVDCRECFGGDLDDMMLIAVLGQRMLSVMLEPRATAGGDEDRYRLSALRLSEITHVPRETVRRKLVKLQAKGWVHGDRRRGWRLTGGPGEVQAGLDLCELDMRGRDRLARLVATVLSFFPAERNETTREAAISPDERRPGKSDDNRPQGGVQNA